MRLKNIIKGFVLTGFIAFIAFSCAEARDRVSPSQSSIQAFTDETVAGVQGSTVEVATSAAYNVDGVTSIGLAWINTEGTSTPHVGIGYQTSMDNSNWTSTTPAVTNTTVTSYVAIDSAITIHPTQWIRWILSNALLNATNTQTSLWFKTKKE